MSKREIEFPAAAALQRKSGSKMRVGDEAGVYLDAVMKSLTASILTAATSAATHASGGGGGAISGGESDASVSRGGARIDVRHLQAAIAGNYTLRNLLEMVRARDDDGDGADDEADDQDDDEQDDDEDGDEDEDSGVDESSHAVQGTNVGDTADLPAAAHSGAKRSAAATTATSTTSTSALKAPTSPSHKRSRHGSSAGARVTIASPPHSPSSYSRLTAQHQSLRQHASVDAAEAAADSTHVSPRLRAWLSRALSARVHGMLQGVLILSTCLVLWSFSLAYSALWSTFSVAHCRGRWFAMRRQIGACTWSRTRTCKRAF